MSFNTFGKIFRFTTWGESHGPAIGCIVDGCPPNIPISEKEIQKDMIKEDLGSLNLQLKEKRVIRFPFYLEFFKGRLQGRPFQ